MARRKKDEVRKCRCCGSELRPCCLWVCEECQALGRGRQIRAEGIDARELLLVARKRETLMIDPLKDMDAGEISALAWLFRKSGYGSYGKLRAYVHATGHLPEMRD